MKQFLRRLTVRKAVFALITTLMLCGVVELACLAGLHFLEASLVLGDIQKRQDSLAIGNVAETDRLALHPYSGWVVDANVADGTELFGRTVPVNEFGLEDDGSPIRERSPDQLLVAITGGSVAWQVSVAGEEIIKRELAKHPELTGRTIEIVRIGLSGYKQPQQLTTFAWLTSMGAEYDVVVNLDGFNEVALNLTENVPHHVSIGFPRGWHIRLQELVDPRDYSLEFELFELNAGQQKLAENARQSWFRSSMTYSLVWLLRDNSFRNARLELMSKMLEKRLTPGGRSFASSGPNIEFRTVEALHQRIIDIWANSSLQMRDLCEARQTRYVHVLQPNQYLSRSKIYSDFEQENCLKRVGTVGRFIPLLYPQMVERGTELAEAGVAFVDLTMVFADSADTLYSDDCCHFNERGYELLAQRIATEISNRY